MTELTAAALQARQMYADGMTVRKIVEVTGLKIHQVYLAFDGKTTREGPQLLPAIPRRTILKRPRLLKRAGQRLRVVRRAIRVAEKEMQAIERQLGAGTNEGARQLAMLTRTLRELNALEANLTPAPSKAAETDDDFGPRDIDEFRRELARRMDALVAARTGGGISRKP